EKVRKTTFEGLERASVLTIFSTKIIRIQHGAYKKSSAKNTCGMEMPFPQSILYYGIKDCH
ncbi:MAG: hypothetical protein IJU61_03775, partial [Victivallales bacterium]|nr:hypothetical protein [Victivallales bacterium]